MALLSRIFCENDEKSNEYSYDGFWDAVFPKSPKINGGFKTFHVIWKLNDFKGTNVTLNIIFLSVKLKKQFKTTNKNS